MPAAGVTRSSQSAAPAGRAAEMARKRHHDRHDDDRDRRRAAAHDGAEGEGEHRGHGREQPRADDHLHLGRAGHGEHVVAAGVRDRRAEQHRCRGADQRRRRTTTAATTTAFAASTRPRRGLAANVTRIRPRRYSAVMNSAATTPSAISPANVPTRYSLTVSAESAPPPCPSGIGAMSPDPSR